MDFIKSARRDQKEGSRRKRSKGIYLTSKLINKREIRYYLACKLPGKLSMPALYWAIGLNVHADLHCYTKPVGNLITA